MVNERSRLMACEMKMNLPLMNVFVCDVLLRHLHPPEAAEGTEGIARRYPNILLHFQINE